MAGARAFVVHWNESELPSKCDAVRKAGWAVCGSEAKDGERAGRNIRKTGPDALVVWMSRLPSHGRETAEAVKWTAWGKTLPVVFVHGDPEPLSVEKREKVVAKVPDATWCTPANLGTVLSDVRKRPPVLAIRSKPKATRVVAKPARKSKA